MSLKDALVVYSCAKFFAITHLSFVFGWTKEGKA